MELCGISTTLRWRPVGAILTTAQENRVKRSITIDPTIGSRSNIFHDFLAAVFDGVAWKRYDTLTASGRGHSTDSALEKRVKRSITIDPTVGWRSNVFHEFPEAVSDGVALNRDDMATISDRGLTTNTIREPA